MAPHQSTYMRLQSREDSSNLANLNDESHASGALNAFYLFWAIYIFIGALALLVLLFIAHRLRRSTSHGNNRARSTVEIELTNLQPRSTHVSSPPPPYPGPVNNPFEQVLFTAGRQTYRNIDSLMLYSASNSAPDSAVPRPAPALTASQRWPRHPHERAPLRTIPLLHDQAVRISAPILSPRTRSRLFNRATSRTNGGGTVQESEPEGEHPHMNLLRQTRGCHIDVQLGGLIAEPEPYWPSPHEDEGGNDTASADGNWSELLAHPGRKLSS